MRERFSFFCAFLSSIDLNCPPLLFLLPTPIGEKLTNLVDNPTTCLRQGQTITAKRLALPAMISAQPVGSRVGTRGCRLHLCKLRIIDLPRGQKLTVPRSNPATYRPDTDNACNAKPLVVIVCLNRGLAIQIFNEARKSCYGLMWSRTGFDWNYVCLELCFGT